MDLKGKKSHSQLAKECLPAMKIKHWAWLHGDCGRVYGTSLSSESVGQVALEEPNHGRTLAETVGSLVSENCQIGS